MASNATEENAANAEKKEEEIDVNMILHKIRMFSSSAGVCYKCGCGFVSLLNFMKKLMDCKSSEDEIAKIIVDLYIHKMCEYCCTKKSNGSCACNFDDYDCDCECSLSNQTLRTSILESLSH
jgi:hypothetical protein